MEVCLQLVFYGPKSHWPKSKAKAKDKKRYFASYVKCPCGVQTEYGLVPLKLAIGHFCGHTVYYDEVSYVMNPKNSCVHRSLL